MIDRDDGEWRVWHGMLLLALVCCGATSLRMWPWPLFVPLLAYAAMLGAWPRWRATCSWMKLGSASRGSFAFAALLAAGAVIALLVYDQQAQPDLSSLRTRLILNRWPHAVVWAALFALLNAAMEEAVFRGALFDASVVRFGMPGAVVVSSVLFGVMHIGGYPPGVPGVMLSGLFGAALAGLRIWTGGLFLPTVVHVFADATIAWILLNR